MVAPISPHHIYDNIYIIPQTHPLPVSYAETLSQPLWQSQKNHNKMIHNNHNTLRIPFGNDFRLAICRDDVAPGNHTGVTFADVHDLRACIVSALGRRIQVQHQVAQDGDLMLTVLAEPLRCMSYAVVITGSFQGHKWRWSARKCFTIVPDNDAANMAEIESFDIETYYLHDTLSAQIIDTPTDTTPATVPGGSAAGTPISPGTPTPAGTPITPATSGETLEIITHGQATIIDGEILITADNVVLSEDGEELIITI